ncbi:hypothetical protein M3J09_013227 [Ascochyta lentis]
MQSTTNTNVNTNASPSRTTTNADWYATPSDTVGGIWEGSLFPAGRDERVWGRGERVEGEAPMSSEVVVRSEVPMSSDEARFPDVLPDRSIGYEEEEEEEEEEGVNVPPLTEPSPTEHLRMSTPGTFSPEKTKRFLDTLTLFPVQHRHRKTATESRAPSTSHSPHTATPLQPTTTTTHPASSPPQSSPPRNILVWDDANLLSLWKWKVIRKKGYEPMVAHFEGQTVESLHRAWVENRGRCKELGQAWREAGKPGGMV